MSAKCLLAAVVVAAVVALGVTISERLADDPLADLPSSRVTSKSNHPSNVSPPQLPPSPVDDFVGSVACTECHAEVASQYATHPMSRSLTRVTAAHASKGNSSPPEFTTPPGTHQEGTLRYYVESEGDRVLHHEVRTGGENEELYDQAVEVHYEIGSGQRGHSYLIDRGGMFFMSPITWYSEKSRWDLSPGYSRNNRRFERRAVDACVNCHSGRPAHDLRAADRFHSPPFIEEQIGCERCHGPGGRHIAYHRQREGKTEVDPIVNPERLSPHLRDAVCNQCHLQGADRILRYGRTEYDFRPGDSLDDIWTIFMRESDSASGTSTKAVSQTRQMMASRCYKESAGQLGCISCHDPHAAAAPEDRVEYFRSKCIECHGNGASECLEPAEERRVESIGDSCIDCHMPRLDASDVPHTSQTDHRVPRKPFLEPVVSKQEAVLNVFSPAGTEVPEWEQQRARGLVMAKFANDEKNGVLAKQASAILETVRKIVPEDPHVMLALGTCYSLHGRPDMATVAWRHLLELEPENETALERLATLHQERREFQASAPLFDRLLKLMPWRHDLHGRYALSLGQLSQLDSGIEIAERGLELNPSAWQLHDWLSDAYTITGKPDRAEFHRLRSELMRPDDR